MDGDEEEDGEIKNDELEDEVTMKKRKRLALYGVRQ